MSHEAPEACTACRRLKRRCSRNLPICSLCRRLGKDCEYPSHASQGSSSDGWTYGLFQGPDHPFPPQFFLDQDLHSPLRTTQLSWSSQPELKFHALKHLDVDTPTLYNEYASKVHIWLPMLSRKRLLDDGIESSEKTDVCHFVLLLCMKLCIEKPNDVPSKSISYIAAKSLCAAAEQAGYLSLRLVQSLVLLTFYEICHGIQPAAFMTISKSARMGSLIDTPTWTASEEARQTWWAMFVLDRYMLMDVNGLPFSVLDPATEELLPVNDIDWDTGKAVASESLYTSSFSNNTSSSEPLEELVKEALHLDRITSALQVSIQDCCKVLSDETSLFISALAVCCAARFCLSTDMQHLSLEGNSGLVQITLPPLARLRYGCPFLSHCLYYAATEAD
ncbi:unnamed protein product [Fusarium graminearum]|nr:unnamed protein product [Fusarium graminearum]CAF3497755.1 unnamed protein product [Fusarium graminearum]CAG1985880.1 unnamed protein product [Fusarium graminearum]